MSRHHRVVVVFDEDAARDLPRLADEHHVWIVASERNVDAARSYGARGNAAGDALASGVSVFTRVERDPGRALEAVLELVEDHHGEFAHEPPVDEVVVVGLERSPPVTAVLEEWGYGELEPLGEGFLARRCG